MRSELEASVFMACVVSEFLDEHSMDTSIPIEAFYPTHGEVLRIAAILAKRLEIKIDYNEHQRVVRVLFKNGEVEEFDTFSEAIKSLETMLKTSAKLDV